MSMKYKSLLNVSSLRLFSRSCFRKEANKTVSQPPPKNATDSQAPNLETMMKVGSLERFFLVWSGKYKSKEEVPSSISAAVYAGARTKCRIKLANYSMVIFVILAIAASLKGKSLASQGESFAKGSLDKHEVWKKEKEVINK